MVAAFATIGAVPMQPHRLAKQLKKIVGKDAVLDRPEDLMLYEYDGGVDRGTPQIVCFPQTTEQVSQIARLATKENIPIVPRGGGPGRSGGPMGRLGGIVVGFPQINTFPKVYFAN